MGKKIRSVVYSLFKVDSQAAALCELPSVSDDGAYVFHAEISSVNPPGDKYRRRSRYSGMLYPSTSLQWATKRNPLIGARLCEAAASATFYSEVCMAVYEFVSIRDVQEACRELGIRDWTKPREPAVTLDEARIIQDIVGGEATQIPLEEFRIGLEVELEHGLQFPDANVTNNHPLLTGMIVLAHLKEMLDYYPRLEVAELEGEVHKAFLQGDGPKMQRKYEKLVAARRMLSQRDMP
jgi:hypothetical protein